MSFSIKNVGKWIDELSVRAVSITNEYVIEFDEFQDFYVSKFFDSHNGRFNCDIKIKFYDTKLNNVCYEKLFKDKWLHICPIEKLSANSEEKLIRKACIEDNKRKQWEV